jgi:hypothetical protein
MGVTSSLEDKLNLPKIKCSQLICKLQSLLERCPVQEGHTHTALIRLLDEIKKIREDHLQYKAIISVQCSEMETLLVKNLDLLRQLSIYSDHIANLEDKCIYIPQEISELAEIITHSYPHRRIVTNEYPIEVASTTPNMPKNQLETKKADIDIRDFITTLAGHREWCKERGLSLREYLDMHPSRGFGEVINMLQFDVYREYMKTRGCIGRNRTSGGGWTPSIDRWYTYPKNSTAISLDLLSLFHSAGLVNELEAFSWGVCGQTRVGEHMAVCCYDFTTKRWRMLEPTLRKIEAKSFYNLPLCCNTATPLNFTSVWFSFNSQHTRHKFEDCEAEQTFHERKRFKSVRILE